MEKEKEIRYCKNEKCNKGKNESRKILTKSEYHGFKQYCSDDCERIDKNLPFYCQNIKCNKEKNEKPKKLERDSYNHILEKYCCKICLCKSVNLGKKMSQLQKLKHRKRIKKVHDNRSLEERLKINKKISLSVRKTYENNPNLKISLSNFRKGKTYEEIMGIKKAEILKSYLRKQRLLEIEDNLKSISKGLKIGKYETILLDKQEQIDNCKIHRSLPLYDLGYIIDGYCLETNTVYEVYEKKHLNFVEKDLQRQKQIQNYLNCKFKIIWDKQ